MDTDRTSIKEITGTRVYKGKTPPRCIGKIHDVVFFPDRIRVAGFITRRADLLLMFKRKRHFISIKGYYTYEDLAFVRPKKGSLNKSAYRSLGLDPGDCVQWLGLAVITEDGQSAGVVSDVVFAPQSGEVLSIESSLSAIGKVLQGTRTIPAELVRGFRKNAILVASEALNITVDTDKGLVTKTGKQVSAIASNAGIDTATVSEKAKSAAETAGMAVAGAAVATGKHLEKTSGMFAAFKEEYDKARRGD